MRFQTRQSTDREVLFVDTQHGDDHGPSVAVQFDTEAQQWGVYVNTEAMDEPTGREVPVVDIYLNDATLYDAAKPSVSDLTADELDLLIEALDSHQYWQLSDASRRNDGSVMEPLTEAERACDTLAEKLGKFARPARTT